MESVAFAGAASNSMRDEAIRFWSDLQNNHVVSMFFSAHVFHLSKQYRDSNYPEEFRDDLDRMLREDLGYTTTYDEILAVRDDAIENEPGYWRGCYWLFDEHGNYNILWLVQGANNKVKVYYRSADDLGENIDLKNGAEEIVEFSFESRTLRFRSKDAHVELHFSTPFLDKIDEMDVGDILSLSESGVSIAVRCSGRITVNDTDILIVDGKKDVYSPDGAKCETYDDKIEFWNALYQLVDTAEGQPDYIGQELLINGCTSELTGNPEVELYINGCRCDGNIYFRNNVLSWESSQNSGHFSLARNFKGYKHIKGAITSGDEDYFYTGYVKKLPKKMGKKYASSEKNLIRTIAYAADTGQLDIKTTQEVLDKHSAYINNMYSFQFEAAGGNEPYIWSTEDELPGQLKLHSTGRLSGNIPADCPAGVHTFKVKVRGSGVSENIGFEKTFKFSIEKLNDLTIEEIEPIQVVTNTEHTYRFSANGGDESSYQWSIQGDTYYGLDIDCETGDLTVNISAPGDYDVTIKVEDAFGQQATQTCRITIQHKSLEVNQSSTPAYLFPLIGAALLGMVGFTIFGKYKIIKKKFLENVEEVEGGMDKLLNTLAKNSTFESRRRLERNFDKLVELNNNYRELKSWTKDVNNRKYEYYKGKADYIDVIRKKLEERVNRLDESADADLIDTLREMSERLEGEFDYSDLERESIDQDKSTSLEFEGL
ncbi:COG1470 family protein [Microbulbifer epialgicus]|uniref:Ig domain-containing protein n=1 Tax=Microbulbifer epialgicus TaxID=393907 RepID=A0ABV4NVA9_9GAMM